jgi:MSHA biogenesis protein MshP
MRRVQSGLGAIAAIMILVILAALSAAIISFSSGQQLASAHDVLASRAWQVASAGTEGGLYRALKSNLCDTQTWTSADDPAFKVTVVCSAMAYKDGERPDGAVPPGLTFRQLRVFRVVATACNSSAAACPDDAASAGVGYVERQRVAIAYCTLNLAGTGCETPEP